MALFRILFGGLMLYEVFFYASSGLIEAGIVGPRLLFPYEGLEWVRPMDLGGMKFLLGVLALSCVMVILGLLHRIAMSVLFLGLTYIFLLDKAYYNNHTYLFILLAFLMIWIPADRAWSIKRKKQEDFVPYWCWLILRIQIVIVYFYGGLAKLNHDWLVEGEPMRTLLQGYARTSAFGDIITSQTFLYFFTIGGLLFDLLAGPLLWWKKSRRYMLVFVLFFNITNHFLFDDIGVFPFFMIAATILFFDPHEIAAWFGRVNEKDRRSKVKQIQAGNPSLITAALAAYLAFQLLFPFRWMVMGVDPDWTSVAQRFSWRMKISTRSPLLIAFNVEEPLKKDSHPVQLKDFINNYQQNLCAYDPRAAVRFAKWLKGEAMQRGMEQVQITSRIVISYNGRPYRYLFPVDQDLSMIDLQGDPDEWIPAKEDPSLELSPKEIAALKKTRKSN